MKTPKRLLLIVSIVGVLLGGACCLAIGAYVLFARTMNNITQVSNPWVRSLAWSPDGSQLAVGSADHTITIWEVKSATLLLTITHHNGSVRELAWSPDGMMLAAGDQTGAIYIWNPLTGQPVEQLTRENEQDALGFLAWSPDGSRLAFTGDKGNIMIWDVANRQKTVFAQSKNGITGISWSSDDARLATSSADGTVSIWDLQTGQSIWIIDAHKGWVNDVDWASSGTLLASVGDDGLLKVWDAETGQIVQQSVGLDQGYGIDWSPTVSSSLAWGSGFDQVTITDIEGLETPLEMMVNSPTSKGQIWVVAWSPDGQQLAAGTEYNTVVVWDAATGQQIQLLTLPMP